MSPTTSKPEESALPKSISCDVAIVGYGPVGMVLSGLLAQRGFNVIVVERHHTLYPLARAGHYDGETMRTFQALGVADAVEIAAQPMLLWNLVTADMEVLATIHLGEGGAGWKESYLSYQPEIEKILDARARELGVTVYNGVEALQIDQSADRATVTCRPVDDENAELTVIDAAFVIGADGANSFVRESLGIERAQLGFAPMDSLVIDFKLNDSDRELDRLPEVLQVLDPERPQLAGRWEGRNYSRFEFILHEGEDAEEFAAIENCWKLLEMWDLSPADGEIERGIVYRFEATLAPEWRDGRILLAGDAAHTMPPTMGQGLCSGIRDAINLVWKLDAVLRDQAEVSFLDTVHSERSAHVQHLIEMCVGLGEMWNTRDLESAHRRDEMLRMGNVPPAPAFPRLGAGIVAAETDHSLIVDGRPAPQGRVAFGGQADRLDEFASGWQIVSRHALPDGLFSAGQQSVLDELEFGFSHVSRGPGPDYYIDVDGEYELWFRKHGVRAFIQRPDKYVFGAVAELTDLPALVDALGSSLEDAGWKFAFEREAVDSDDISVVGSARIPYPETVDFSHASDAAEQLFTSFFSAKTRRKINETHVHFHPDQVYYADATLGWHWDTNEELRGVWKQYMPFWKSTAKSYPVQVAGDTTTGAAVVVTDTPELFGGEIRAIAIIDFADEKITRWIDYWDGRGFGSDAVSKMRTPAENFPDTVGEDTVDDRHAPEMAKAVDALMRAIASGDAAQLDKILAYDATFEDFALRTQLRGSAAIARYIKRASGRLPYQGADVIHIVGNAQGGGFEWMPATPAAPRGAAIVTLNETGKVTSLGITYDGAALDDDQIITLSGLAVEPRR
ncbi:bifunctional 3-(3-hydroxy-phenyl)propionate/3-hydroxycinnamic acid hydroxylase [Subtercola lobariae]|uniref:Bifunctional 3-(3-hydroxy-phenyl)propionate/3-hydroxycinnamic acid hydroxylase n=1 Tax=Subtercola lobariae TaxID=1588641 RepID=A0A917B4D7_9MICO|nr:bifunctional 3-(3-hydroxy-phenyl)propionate/3-hydroxycinnamic acid hydroxylase [Subtercola lobariae]GGF22759.1 hypothetical protein GCM10011399_15500 [Subtercola lobariae]